jgi:hypothetical protein
MVEFALGRLKLKIASFKQILVRFPGLPKGCEKNDGSVPFDLQVITHHQAPDYVNNFFKIQNFSSCPLILWVFIKFITTDRPHV